MAAEDVIDLSDVGSDPDPVAAREHRVRVMTGQEPPTKLERNLYGALDAVGMPYDRQVRLGYHVVDALLCNSTVAVEADGCVWHGCQYCLVPDEPRGEHERALRLRAESHHRDWLVWRYQGVCVVHIWGHALEDEAVAVETLSEFRAAWKANRLPYGLNTRSYWSC
jgi:G:T-mismatch repair DNA endonuclease (very short patch repair protein)